MTFKDFNFKSRLAYAISRAGFKEPSAIQQAAIPLVLDGKDVVGQAHTGTGKTAAFALPLLQHCTGKDGVEVVVVVPTRELATQVSDEFFRFSRNLDMRTATVYGGSSYGRQINFINQSTIVVATPGRLLDLLSRGKINIQPWAVVLDEADEMLNMGFLEDVRRIFEFFPNRKQTLMFSATMPAEIKDLARTLMSQPEFIRVEKEAVTKNSIVQHYYVVEEHERDDALLRLLEINPIQKAIVFCRTKRETARLAEFLLKKKYKAAALHGDMEQYDRQKVMKAFKKNEYDIMVATDVAARGIDVRGVTHVINYHIPLESESYVHRIGRTGRADKEGIAMLLVTPGELRELKRIQKDVGSDLQPQSLPQKQLALDEKITIIHEHLDQESPNAHTQGIVKKMLTQFKHDELVHKLMSLFEKTLIDSKNIGKSEKEISHLLDDVGDDIQSENTKSSQRYKKRNQSAGRNHRKQKTNRDEILKPDIKKMGNSRVVARKIY